MRELILLEILAVPAERSRGRHNPRVVKRKMSSFPTKARAAPPSGRVFRYEDHIRVVAPPDPPTERAPMPATPPEARPKRRRPRKASAARTDDRPSWLEQVRSWRASGLSRAAFCERHGLNPRTFHHWVARSRQSFRKPSSRSPRHS
jgi:hypothetical protein